MKRWIRIFAPMVALALVVVAAIAALGNTNVQARRADPVSAVVVAQAQPQAPTVTVEPDEGSETPDAQEGPETPDAQEGPETPDAQEGPETPDAQEGPETPDADESAEAAALASKVAISEQQAVATALAANPGATMVKVSLDDENGVIVYSVELDNGTDVKVDAITGQITSVDQAGAEEEGNDVEHVDETPTVSVQP
ncbi:PepSY domain-containing protein [Chloroflexus aggregans]|uniref:Propeptide PepSY amd peptidase M4 n=1 Tax=Chloroflexus aggregans (strain MD-66 / DSM 9485) TaxID=326427 RepID=B8G9I4_CHLAD|nr:PepSY domain-containing protein [Chloroflexus aggregans]ACL26337.1 Propeptide PepSY amd peptidase M4 [Chloroflexus aggregans DSM 9485]